VVAAPSQVVGAIKMKTEVGVGIGFGGTDTYNSMELKQHFQK